MVITDTEFLLVNPDKTRLGWGVVHFIAFLQVDRVGGGGGRGGRRKGKRRRQKEGTVLMGRSRVIGVGTSEGRQVACKYSKMYLSEHAGVVT